MTAFEQRDVARHDGCHMLAWLEPITIEDRHVGVSSTNNDVRAADDFARTAYRPHGNVEHLGHFFREALPPFRSGTIHACFRDRRTDAGEREQMKFRLVSSAKDSGHAAVLSCQELGPD